MTPTDPLCQLPAMPSAGCCDLPALPPAAPLLPDNQPGLSAIRYRIGTFTSFRRAMLGAARRPDLLNTTLLDAVRHTAPANVAGLNPFSRWREGSAGDYLTMAIELWAYLADILTFYQERIANEALLPTATQRDSLARLAGLIDYRPNPGAAASARVAFTVEKGKSISIPARFRVGSRAAPGKPPAVFETDAAVGLIGDHSAIPLSAVAPTNQFAPLNIYGHFFGNLPFDPSVLVSAGAVLYGNAAANYVPTFPRGGAAARAGASPAQATSSASGAPAVVAITLPSGGFSSVDIATLDARAQRTDFEYRPYQSATTRTVVLKGVNNRLAVGDYLLVVENEGNPQTEKASPRQLNSAHTDKPTDTTTITWCESEGTTYDQSKTQVALYALRVTAAPFGSNAPDWNTLPPALNGTVNNVHGPYEGKNWDDLSNDWFFLPGNSDEVFLDGAYGEAKGTPDSPGWVVLLRDNDKQIFHLTDARTVNKVGYTLNSKVTRLTLKTGENIPEKIFPLRTTVILTGNQALRLQNNLPLPEPLAGATVILAGQYRQLQAGQSVVLQGKLYDTKAGEPTQTVATEPGVLAADPVVDATYNITRVRLKNPLSQPFARAGAVLLANIVDVSQGETVRDEALGSGNGSAFQEFALKQKPLTYLPAVDPEGLSAVQSTLLVTVNGVRWNEQPTLLERAPNAQEYTTAQDDAEQTTVRFGDAINGARAPSGKDNIRARYRKGMGTSGNVAAGAIAQLIDNQPGLQKVTNPVASLGGADREQSDQIRTNAPASLRTFGRAVSVDDYAALARGYPGVAKASAAWMLRDPATLQAIANPYIQLTIATADRTPLSQQSTFARRLRTFLDLRRDPNVALRMIDFTPVYVDLAAMIDIDDRYPRQATLNAARAALGPELNPDGTVGFLAFERLDFGQSLHLSAAYAALQAVPGVRDATITTFRQVGDPPTMVRPDIFIRPTELAVIANDPEDTNNQKGKLTLTLGQGGFIDL